MSAAIYFGVFALGFLIGAGAMLLYFQYSIYSQASDIQEQFQQIQDLQENKEQETDEE